MLFIQNSGLTEKGLKVIKADIMHKHKVYSTLAKTFFITMISSQNH